MLRKVYIRHREGVPESVNFFAAFDGFRQLGVELASFEGFGDIEAIEDLGPEVGLCGYIGDVLASLKQLGVPAPAPLDYPEPLKPFLGREVRRSTMGEVRRGGRVFVKPVQHKLFTGRVFDDRDAADRLAVVIVPSDTPVWVSDVITIESEYRVFVLRGEIVGVKHYKGDWALAPVREVVNQTVKAYTGAPAAYSLDFGVRELDSGDKWTPDIVDTILIEANDGFALGCYGLESTTYAKMMAARWEELVSGTASMPATK